MQLVFARKLVINRVRYKKGPVINSDFYPNLNSGSFSGISVSRIMNANQNKYNELLAYKIC